MELYLRRFELSRESLRLPLHLSQFLVFPAEVQEFAGAASPGGLDVGVGDHLSVGGGRGHAGFGGREEGRLEFLQEISDTLGLGQVHTPMVLDVSLKHSDEVREGVQ